MLQTLGLASLSHHTDHMPELFSQAPEREEAPSPCHLSWTPPPPDPGDSTSFHSVKELLNVTLCAKQLFHLWRFNPGGFFSACLPSCVISGSLAT